MHESLLRFNKKQRYVVFDTETEGLNLVTSRPWQVAWLVVEGENIIEKNDFYIHWANLNVSEGAARVTGFSYNEYAKKSMPPNIVWEKFAHDLYDENNLIVGQNLLGFDVYMVNVWRKLMGMESDYSYHRERGLRTSQATLLKKYNIDHDPKRLHDALYDIEMNFKIFKKQLFDLEI